MRFVSVLDRIFKVILSVMMMALAIGFGYIWFLLAFVAEGGGWGLTLIKVALFLMTLSLPVFAVKVFLMPRKTGDQI